MISWCSALNITMSAPMGTILSRKTIVARTIFRSQSANTLKAENTRTGSCGDFMIQKAVAEFTHLQLGGQALLREPRR